MKDTGPSVVDQILAHVKDDEREVKKMDTSRRIDVAASAAASRAQHIMEDLQARAVGSALAGCVFACLLFVQLAAERQRQQEQGRALADRDELMAAERAALERATAESEVNGGRPGLLLTLSFADCQGKGCRKSSSGGTEESGAPEEERCGDPSRGDR